MLRALTARCLIVGWRDIARQQVVAYLRNLVQ